MTEETLIAAREALATALRRHGIPLHAAEGRHVEAGTGYSIEIEANGIYRLCSDGSVIAPFDDLEELCAFIALG
jgi:hypothetical protein